MKNKLLIAAFLEGFILLCFELLSAQLLHPFYGNSYFVWIAILSVTMLGSAFGYFLGGFISKKDDKLITNYSFIALVVISIFALSFYKMNDAIFRMFNAEELIYASIMQTSYLLIIPVTLVTSFNPIIVKFFNESHAGKSSSKVFFISTLGGVVCIYLLAFGILPSLELMLILKIFGFLILLISIGYYLLIQRMIFVLIHVLLGGLLFFGITINQKERLKGANSEIIYRSHGIMGEIEVREEHNKVRYLSINRTTQSAIRLDNNNSLWSYPYRVATYASIAPPKSDVLVAGLGGGILVNHLIDLDFNIDCIEFDRRTIGVAKKYMGLRALVDLKIDDFRHYINATDKKYDLIILDLSKGESLPTNVYTVEAFQKMQSLLKPGGFILLHYFSDVYGTGKLGLKSVIKTMKRSGLFTSLVKKHEQDKNPEQIVIGSNDSQIISNLQYRLPPELISNYGFVMDDIFDKDFDITEGLTLHDGNASLERAQFNVVSEIRRNLRNNEFNVFFKNKK